jgi:hypothetical protein
MASQLDECVEYANLEGLDADGNVRGMCCHVAECELCYRMSSFIDKYLTPCGQRKIKVAEQSKN